MRKVVIWFAVGFGLLAGLWAYCVFWSPPLVLGMARGATENLAQRVGIHIFDVQPEGGKAATKLTVSDLPDGYYIFIGGRPFEASPRWVAVNPGGTISWLNSGATQPVAVAPALANPQAKLAAHGDGSTVSGPTAGPDERKHFLQYNYPTIKWEGKDLPDGNGAAAQLETKYLPPTVPETQGLIQYKLLLLKPANLDARRVQLLDNDGFKIFEFKVSDFQKLPNNGDPMWEARDSFPCNEEIYRQARDYSVN